MDANPLTLSSTPLVDPLDMARKGINAQEELLGIVAGTLLGTAEQRVAEQEDELLSVVRPLIAVAQERLAYQQADLDSLLTVLAGEARARVSTQRAGLASIPELPEGTFPVRQGDHGEPPGTSGGYTHDGVPQDPSLCQPLPWEPQFSSPCLRAVRDESHPSGWGVLLILTDDVRCTPNDVFIPPVTTYSALFDDGSTQIVRVPPNVWPRGMVRVTSPDFVSSSPEYSECRWSLVVQDERRGQPPTIGQPIQTPPFEPIIIRPPGDPPIGDPISLPPIDPIVPIDPSCQPTDPCYRTPLHREWARRIVVPPLAVPFWLRLRCIDGCSADVECLQGDCPPAPETGWRLFGPWLNGCPGEAEIWILIRHCLTTEPPTQQPTLPPTGDRVDIERPPPRQPPPGFTEPPPIDQCERPKPIRPSLQSDVYVPVCRTYEEWMRPVVEEIEGYGDIGELALAGVEAPDPELELPTYLQDAETFGR